MGRLKKEIIEKNKLDYKDFIDDLIGRVKMYWIQLKKTSSLNIVIPNVKILLYFPFIPRVYKNPEVYIVIREDEKFTYLMAKLFNTETVQIFIIHNSLIFRKNDSSDKEEKDLGVCFPVPFGSSYKSPIIAIECPDSLRESYLFKNILLKDKQLNSFVVSQLKYFSS